MENKEYIEKLVFAAKNGNTECFERLYGLFYQKIYALCLTTLKNSADAEDALQMTFTNAWQKLPAIEDPGAFNTWLQRIALSRCYDILRKRNINFTAEDFEGEDLAESVETENDMELPQIYAEKSDLKDRLKLIIDNLSDVQRQTLTLYYFSELSIEEIADVMECNVSTVKSRLFLARKSIKTEIEEQESRTGQKFFGVVGIPMLPFSNIFVSQVRSATLSPNVATAILKGISDAVAGMARRVASGTKAVGNMANTAFNAQNTATATAKGVGVAVKGAKAGSVAAKGVGVGATVKAAGATVTTKVVSIFAAAVIAIGGAVGGTIAVKNYLDKKEDDNKKTETHGEYVDVELEAEQEVIDLLSRYCISRSEFYNYDKDFFDARCLYGIIGEPASVDYSKYSVVEPKYLDVTESEKALKKSGLAVQGLDYLQIIEYDKESVFWIATNIFNFKENVIEDMVSKAIEECVQDNKAEDSEIFSGKGDDGKEKYYLAVGGKGWFGQDVDITWARTDGEYTYVKFDVLRANLNQGSTFDELQKYGFGIENFETNYAKMERKEIDGKKYWTLYEISGEIPKGIFETEENSIPSDFAGDYNDTNGYAEVNFDDNGKCTAKYHRFIGSKYNTYAECDCSVDFTDISKADKYLYTAKIEKIEYKNEIGTAGKSGEMNAEYVEMPYFGEGETVHIYLKGTPITKVLGSEGNVDFVFDSDQTELESDIIVFVDSKFAFYK